MIQRCRFLITYTSGCITGLISGTQMYIQSFHSETDLLKAFGQVTAGTIRETLTYSASIANSSTAIFPPIFW